MPTYLGHLIDSESDERLSAVLTIDKGDLTVKVAQSNLGTFKLSQMRIGDEGDGKVWIDSEGERLIFELDSAESFLAETAPYRRGQDRLQRSAEHPAFREDQTTLSDDMKAAREEIQRLSKQAASETKVELGGVGEELKGLLGLVNGPALWGGVVALILMIIFASGLVVALGLLVALVALVAGAISYADDGFAEKLPAWANPPRLIAIGIVALVIGILGSVLGSIFD